MSFLLPKLYPIVDTASLRTEPDPTAAICRFALELAGAGVTILQLRDKSAQSRETLSTARELRRLLPQSVCLIMNDRADLCLAAGFDGVHVGQDDLPPEIVRGIVGNNAVIGFSTHNPSQVVEADRMPIDYVAVGPVFATSSKLNPDPVIGLEGVRRARALTRKPIVAIGGITRVNCADVIAAGADSIAVIADLQHGTAHAAREFILKLETAIR